MVTSAVLSLGLFVGAASAGTGHWALGTGSDSAAGIAQAPVPSAQTPVPAGEVIAEVRVHGNHVTSDDDVVKISGVTIGQPFTATTISEVTAKLKAAKKFDDVSVLKRFASIEDASKIVLVIVVNEGPVRLDVPKDPNAPISVVRRRGIRNLMFMPILTGEDGYGFTFGARLAFVGVTGKRSRVSFPLTWGGTRQAGAELEHLFKRGPLTRVELGSAVQSQKNPAYVPTRDRRERLWVTAERAAGPWRLGTTTSAQWVQFGAVSDNFRSVGGTVAFDTRTDPVMPRNAVFGSSSLQRLFFGTGPALNRIRLDGRGYLGLFHQNVLVFRAVRESTSGTAPLYLRSLLGGWSSLRGFKAGAFTGDTIVHGSVELRIPLNSPLSFAKLGVSAFVDTGTAYDHGHHLTDQKFHTGIGGAGWVTVTFVNLGVSVAHGIGSGTRVNFGAGISF